MSKKCTPLWCEAHLRSEKATKHTQRSDHFWKLRCRKSARRCGAKHISKSKCTKHRMFASFLEVQMSFRAAGARDCSQKWAKREGFVAFPQTMAGEGHLKRICKDAFSRGRRSTRDMFIRAVRRSGRWFSWEEVAFFGASWSSGLLRWFCVIGAALRMTWHHFFVAGAVV